MATTSELMQAGLFLVANTIGIGVFILVGGPIFGLLTNYISTNYVANPIMPASIVQWIPGFFFTMLLLIEIILVVRIGYVVVSTTDYRGESEW